jgi:hypothetical protein
MKKGRKNRPREVRAGFVRGFVAAGLLAAIQDAASPARDRRRLLRLALQGGGAMAAGVAVAEALDAGRPGAAASALVAGTCGLLAIEHLLNEQTCKEQQHG